MKGGGRGVRVWLLVVSVAALAVLAFWQYRSGRPRVVFCDVGQGDGILFLNGGLQVVVDTGKGDGKILRCLEKYVPFWDKRIEGVIISHGDEDHRGGLARIVEYYKIDNLIEEKLKAGDFEQVSSSVTVGFGDVIKFGEYEFEVLRSPGGGEEPGSGGNERSAVLLFSYKDINILLMGDVGGEDEQELVWRGVIKDKTDGEVEVLKVGHHGSATATSWDLLRAASPKTAVISVGKNNSFGHPAAEVLRRLEEAGVEVRRTDVEGDVVIELEASRQ